MSERDHAARVVLTLAIVMLTALPARSRELHIASVPASPRPDPCDRAQTSWEEPCTVWPDSALPAGWYDDGQPLEVGFKFRSAVPGQVTAIRFHQGACSRGPHLGHLWARDGRLLAEARFRDETASGWQVATLSRPIALEPGTTYVASVHCADGLFPFTAGYFECGPVNGPLHALADGEDGPNGIFCYSPVPAFPTRTFRAANYWVDVVVRYSLQAVAQAASRAPLARSRCGEPARDPRAAAWYQARIRALAVRLRQIEIELDALNAELDAADPAPAEDRPAW